MLDDFSSQQVALCSSISYASAFELAFNQDIPDMKYFVWITKIGIFVFKT